MTVTRDDTEKTIRHENCHNPNPPLIRRLCSLHTTYRGLFVAWCLLLGVDSRQLRGFFDIPPCMDAIISYRSHRRSCLAPMAAAGCLAAHGCVV